MARKKAVVETPVTLDELIPVYGEVKANLDTYKKQESDLNKKIKTMMSEEGRNSWISKEWRADYSVRISDVYDTDALLDYAHKHKAFKDCIKTKEYIDETALESLIYDGKIPQKQVAELDKFRTKKEVQVLKVKRVGE